MRVVACAFAALTLAACASQAPYAQHMTAEQIALAGPTSVSVTDNNLGMVSTWPKRDSSAAAGGLIAYGTPQGIAGGLLSIGIDALANSEPQRRAIETADEFETIFTAEALNASLEEGFRQMIAAESAGRISVADVSRSLKVSRPEPINNAIEVLATYEVAEYSNALRITAYVTYRDETGAPRYANRFVYYSRELEAPELDQEVRVALVNAIHKRFRDADGQLPRYGTIAQVDFTRDIREARDDFMTRAERAILVTDQWTRDDGALLRAEIANAQALLARYVLLDINSTPTADVTTEDQLVETLPDGRTVYRLAGGFWAGSYEFRPAGGQPRAHYPNGLGVSTMQQAKYRWLLDQATTHSGQAAH